MGGTTETKTDNTPWAPAQPYILKGMQQTGEVFDQTQPDLNNYATMQRDQYGRASGGAEAGISGAQNLVNQNLSGANLGGNPYLDGIMAKTNAAVTAGVNDQFGTAGRFGSGYHAKILGDSLASADNDLLSNNYNTQLGIQQSAIGQAQSLEGGAQSLLNNAADLPYVGVGALNGNIRQASNGYGTQTTTQTADPFSQMMQLGGLGLSAAKTFSDRRLKSNIEKVATLPDGLGVYDFDYIADAPVDLPAGRQRGVMADEVAYFRPWALATPESGFHRVDYGAL